MEYQKEGMYLWYRERKGGNETYGYVEKGKDSLIGGFVKKNGKCPVPKAAAYSGNMSPTANTRQYHVFIGRPERAPWSSVWRPPNQTWQEHVRTLGSVCQGYVPGDVGLCVYAYFM